MSALGKRLKLARESSGMSQMQFAVRVGVSQACIAKIENGTSKETKKLPQLAKALGWTVDELLEFVSGDDGGADRARELGNYIKERRKALGMTQLAVANRIGVTKGAVSHWEQGRVGGIDPGNFHHLAALLKFDDAHIQAFNRPVVVAELPLLPPNEMEVIHLYARLPEHVRKHVLGVIEALSQAQPCPEPLPLEETVRSLNERIDKLESALRGQTFVTPEGQ